MHSEAADVTSYQLRSLPPAAMYSENLRNEPIEQRQQSMADYNRSMVGLVPLSGDCIKNIISVS